MSCGGVRFGQDGFLDGARRPRIITPDGRKVLLFSLVSGDTFGAAALLSHTSEYHVSAETVRDSSVLMWDRRTIRVLAAEYPGF